MCFGFKHKKQFLAFNTFILHLNLEFLFFIQHFERWPGLCWHIQKVYNSNLCISLLTRRMTLKFSIDYEVCLTKAL